MVCIPHLSSRQSRHRYTRGARRLAIQPIVVSGTSGTQMTGGFSSSCSLTENRHKFQHTHSCISAENSAVESHGTCTYRRKRDADLGLEVQNGLCQTFHDCNNEATQAWSVRWNRTYSSTVLVWYRTRNNRPPAQLPSRDGDVGLALRRVIRGRRQVLDRA